MILSNLKNITNCRKHHAHVSKWRRKKIYSEPAISKNDTTMKQHSDPPKTRIKRREPIIDSDYNIGPVDREATKFLVQSYEDAVVVYIDDHSLQARELLQNVSQQSIFGEVIFFHIHVSSKHMCTPNIY
jgi:hypothetical protein